MHRIIEKRNCSSDVYYMKFEAPEIARNRKAGQFIIVQVDTEYGERIPLTIADADAAAGWVAIVFQVVGASTYKIAQKNVGEELEAVLGPLGVPSHIEKHDAPVVCVAGGIGAAPLYPIVEALKAAGNKVIFILGARTKELLLFEEELRTLVDELIVTTDDGSAGRKGVVTIPLDELCRSQTPPAQVIAIGPPIMMKFCAQTTKPHKIPIVVSLNSIMIDGTGMCGCCRVNVGGDTKFVCVDGPDFDGHLVDWDNMLMRMGSFREFETEEFHKCKVGLR